VSSTEDVYARLRELVLSGEFSPNTVLSQVQLAHSLGVSVTPVREAMRLLQAEGYLTAQHNRRARVAPVDPGEVDGVYACRIVIEGLATRLTVPAVTDPDVVVLTGHLERMQDAARVPDIPAWEAEHKEFHRLLAAGCDAALMAVIWPMVDRCERYRRTTHVEQDAEACRQGSQEHEQLVAAYAARDADGAAALLAAHLARSAVVVIRRLAPDRDPVAVRAALGQVRRGSQPALS
jgi:DNA-binding GntR family transcriptional regulator